MTIPSRPAPPPPPKNNESRSNQSTLYGATSSTSSRYTPTTNWDDSPFENDFFQMPSANDYAMSQQSKKPPPPRPPPPKLSAPALKKPTQQTSINILSNLFGKPKQQIAKSGNYSTNSKLSNFSSVPPKLPAPPSSNNHHHNHYGTTSNSTDPFELISFDSPPNSPTFTQKSNSDCTSIGSFSSDTNCSPQNGGNVSQAESGFEDDFSSSTGYVNNTWDHNDPFSPLQITKPTISQKPTNVGGSSFFVFDKNINKTNIPEIDERLCNGKSLLPPPPVLVKPTIIKPVGGKPAISKAKPKLYDKPISDVSQYSMSMPTCPPPPAPVSETNEESFGYVMFPFDAVQSGDLNLRENEKVYLLKKLNDEWYYGKNRRGCEGMFPSSYIDVKVPLNQYNISSSTSSSIISNQNININSITPLNDKMWPSSSTVPQEQHARVLYDFIAETTEDLTLKENDHVTILYAINNEWLYGKIGLRQGQFPSNFIEYE